MGGMRWIVFGLVVAAVGVLPGALLHVTRSSHAQARPVPKTRPVVRHRPKRIVRPPQFVVVSFDGSGGARLLGYWRGVSRRAHARFTFFVSGVYLLDWAHHDRYRPPEKPRGYSAIGFAPDHAWVEGMRRQLAAAYADGDEIGTHFNGHFCGPGGVGTWSAADWSQELDQFDRLLFGAGPLPFGRREVVGARTPCLEGNLAALYPVLARRGFLYDASRQARLGVWPSRLHGLWSIPLPELPLAGHTFAAVAMDYNFFANQIAEPDAQAEDETYRTLWHAFQVSYFGNRAPLQIGQHFETWKGWAYDHALVRFLLVACRLPEVRCTTMRAFAQWLGRQTPPSLRHYRAGRFPKRRTLAAR
jgi:hypothetical protein